MKELEDYDSDHTPIREAAYSNFTPGISSMNT